MQNEPFQPEFIPGLVLAEGFFHEAVEPILKSRYPELRYSAALIGSGSEVLGFDTDMSRDHHWGPRAMLFLQPTDFKSRHDAIHRILGEKMPPAYRGYSTNFSPPDPDDHGTQMLRPVTSGPINHRVDILTLDGYFSDYLNIRLADDPAPADWLTLPHQKLRSIISGKVFRDDLGLEALRQRFSWYPHDVWLYVLASAWARIGQEEHLMGRAGITGDEIGSSLIGSRLVRDVMRLAFLMEKQYPPYAKWFGTAFSRLRSAGDLAPALKKALIAATWHERETNLCTAYETLVKMHNALKITEYILPEVHRFFSRPFRVIGGERIAKVILKQIKDPQVTALPRRSPIGSIDLFSDNTDLLEDSAFRLALKEVFE